ncbi:helix-turn-helix domain-containing protein [Sinomonas atrocyanea]|uniref:helix-turn-helix domain-containing protein n=1 Tax=Sinomonas atrocyanea TaxID=37927 RepID=UPI00082BB1DB|nr:helix-turn-helix transcriptional regulator [Sinomonas atrocyanea]
MQLVAIIGADHRITALPLSLDPDYADATTTCISAEANPLGVPVTAWAGLATTLPAVVLDRFAGQLDHDTAAALAAGQTAAGADPSAPEQVRMYRALLEDAMEELSAARWYEDGSGELSRTMQRAGLEVREVADLLGTTPQKALAIWRGRMPLALEEAKRLAPVMGASAEELLTRNPVPPPDLVGCLDNPRRLHQILAYAAKRGIDAPTAYRDLAYQTWALAARQTGGKATNWDLRLDTIFAADSDEQ